MAVVTLQLLLLPLLTWLPAPPRCLLAQLLLQRKKLLLLQPMPLLKPLLLQPMPLLMPLLLQLRLLLMRLPLQPTPWLKLLMQPKLLLLLPTNVAGA